MSRPADQPDPATPSTGAPGSGHDVRVAAEWVAAEEKVAGPVRLAIVDDHPIARRGLQHMLAEVAEVEVAASVGSLAELREAFDWASVRGPPLDVVILDLYLDGEQPSLDAVRELAGVTRVLVMSASGRPEDVLNAVRAGAAGYLTKQSGTELVIAAVTAVAAGGFALSPKLADVLHAELARAGAEPRRAEPVLSAREEEALQHIARGLTHAQTARRMGVSKATVDTYVERIRAKLQVGNKAQLAVAYRRLHGDRPASQ